MKLKLNKKHEYKIGKTKLISVTEFIHKFFEPFNEREIAKKLSFIPKNRLEGKGVRYWLNKWKQSQEEGSFIHREIQLELLDELPDVYMPHQKSKSAFKFLSNYKELIKLPEQQIYSVELGLAGTIDCIIRNKDNSVILIDWKTNEKLNFNSYKGKKGILPPTKNIEDCNINHYYLQLNLYAYILTHYYNEKIDNMIIVHLQDETYSTYNVPVMFDVIGEMIEYDKAQV